MLLQKLLLLLFVSFKTVVSQTCQTQCIRKEIRDLTDGEWKAFSNAVLKLATPARAYGSSEFDIHSAIHQKNGYSAHGSAQFLPWNRKFLSNFELDLQKIDPSVCLPYWNWSMDSAAPQKSVVWKYLGKSRDASSCVAGGLFDNMRSRFSWFGLWTGSSYCVARNGRPFFLASPQMIDRLIYSANFDYSEFATSMELLHGALHVAIGYDMNSLFSPNDILFYLHHAYIDNIWANYQSTLSATQSSQYNGFNPQKLLATEDDIMAPFNVQVQTVLDTQDLCYIYAASKPITVNVTAISVSQPLMVSSFFDRTGLLTFPVMMGSRPFYNYPAQQLPQSLSLSWIKMNYNLLTNTVPLYLQNAILRFESNQREVLELMNQGAYIPSFDTQMTTMPDGLIDPIVPVIPSVLPTRVAIQEPIKTVVPEAASKADIFQGFFGRFFNFFQ